ncbi:hypothetical protein IM792_00845 [Mucilaginibacter sp. JRF]|uniref:hypothetical protein n=1 Tax=Mucilaginibacter sp. JRF TaxID=2780088 RepID=UPI00188090D0|nr:hypothetical protein [Mucilaginibacter sp. JRF]MBE9582984.1 hypothetical protein [Mucilaginibacter sp. JRF]
MARRKVFELNPDLSMHIDFGTYGLIMYYAKSQDLILAEKLFNATQPEFLYRRERDLSTTGIEYDDPIGHFNPNDLVQVVYFIDNVLCPALNREEKPILEMYDGKQKFLDLYDSETGFLSEICLYDSDAFQDRPGMMEATCMNLNELFKESLHTNTPLKIYAY